MAGAGCRPLNEYILSLPPIGHNHLVEIKVKIPTIEKRSHIEGPLSILTCGIAGQVRLRWKPRVSA